MRLRYLSCAAVAECTRRSHNFATPNLLSAVVALIMLMGCGCGGASSSSNGAVTQAPAIAMFAATPAIIQNGESTTLSWSVTGATTLSIQSGSDTLNGSNSTAISSTSVSVQPNQTTQYTLTATNALGSTTSNVTVNVVAVPQILSFTASPAVIRPGQSSTLSWSVSGATSLSIDNGIGTVSGTSITVSPIETTTYKLTCMNDAGSLVYASVTVGVVSPPTVLSFTASPSIISSGQTSTLGFTVSGATTLSIDNGIGSVTGTSNHYGGVIGSVPVSPSATTTYTVTATYVDAASGDTATSTARATVTVSSTPIPIVNSFTVSPPSTGPAGSVTLTAVFDAGVGGSASIDQNIGTVSSGVPVSSGSLNSSTTFTLTLTNGSNSAQAKLRVPVGNLLMFAGQSGTAGSADGQGSAAQFDIPRGIATDSMGNIYVADSYNDAIRKITPGGLVSTLAGNPLLKDTCAPSTLQCYADGIGSGALFYNPTGVAVDASGNVYVADSGNNVIREITPGGVVTTLAGIPGQTGTTDGVGSQAQFDQPVAVALDASGNIFVADAGSNTIRKIAITSTGAVVSTYAGFPLQSGNLDGPAATATFNQPNGVAFDSLSGNVYVADSNNNTIRVITPAGLVNTFAGTAGPGGAGHQDGTGTAATFNYPSAVAVDQAGNVYVTDQKNYTIRQITPAGVVSTIIGKALVVNTTPTGPLPGKITYCNGVAVDPTSGSLYISLNNDLIIKAPY